MISNYLKIAIRNLLKYKFVSFINLFGLTVGLTCCMLIVVYISHELSYDRQHPDAERIYRLTRNFRNSETGAVSLSLASLAPAFGPLLLNDFKEIEKMTRLLGNGTTVMAYQDKIFNEKRAYFADENIGEFFDIKTLRGDPATALRDPFSLMITEEIAHRYFGNEDPINKMVKLSNQFSMKVTGVFKPLPANTHFHPTMFMSFSTLKDSAIYGAQKLATNWDNNSFRTYIKLPPNYDPAKLEARFPAFLDNHIGGGPTSKASSWTTLGLQKLTDIHLRSHMDDEENGDIKRVYVFSAIALFILLIACINYMNLSTARSTLRGREIGVRKVVGASRKEIIWQFLCESLLISWTAMVIAVLLTWATLPMLNRLSELDLSISVLLRPAILLALVLVPFVVGILSGIYPALFMSSFQPVKVLKGLMKIGGQSISFREVLVTFQFAVSIILIISTAIVFRQLHYMQQKSLGFDKEHIVNLPYYDELNDSYEAFRNDLLSKAVVKNVGRSSRIPATRLLDASGARVMRGDSMTPASTDIKYVLTDYNFIPTYGIQLKAGRGFSKEYGTDTAGFVLNESAIEALGFKNSAEAVGKGFGYGARNGRIIGVIQDFHFESMHQKIVPLVLMIAESPSRYGRISVKLSGSDIPGGLASLEETWKRFLPESPIQYTFLEENFATLYNAEQKQQAIFTIFACLAIFIACLGLFGLSAFAISQRVKEIGIRKVLGAGTGSIVTLLSTDFLKLVLIAAIIAFPVAWYAMSNWLQDFAYRTSMPWWIFGIAGLVAAIIAFLTTSSLAVKAAVTNPVKSLKSE